MKLGDLFVQLGVTGDTKELDKTLKQLDKAEKQNTKVAKAEKALGRELTENEKKWLKNKNAIAEVGKGLSGFLKATAGIATSVAGSVIAFDRMANAMFKANQQLITFQRTSGISLNTLNKYASASSLVNYNASLQGTAQSLQNVANNLWDIQMGRGDISPYQELAFVGGKGINPFGKSLEQVIEEVRESIKTVDDLQATNIITRMGFAPEDLMMLRMTKEELQEIHNLFATPQEQEQINKYALQLKKIHLQFALVGQRLQLVIMPYFIKFMKNLAIISESLVKILKNTVAFKTALIGIGAILTTIFAMAHPKLALIMGILTALFLIIDDIWTYFLGGESYFGDFINFISDLLNNILDKLTEIIDKAKELYGLGGTKNIELSQTNKAYDATMKSVEEFQNGNFWGSVWSSLQSGFYNTPTGQLLGNLQPVPTQSTSIGDMNLQTNIYTSQPADKAMGDNINNMLLLPISQQLFPRYR